jgi:hypothetical protein
MSEESRRWSEIGEQLEALGLKLKLHFEQTGHREEDADTLQRLRNSVSEAFEAAGNAVRDDAVRSDVREAGRLFVDAVSATFAKVSGDLKDVAETMKEKAKHRESSEPPKPIDPA